ncbi:MAG: hypothetical protein MUD03_18155 [Pirellula sp.]|nr:hypothetical protein [Pirellula sp.]
MKRISDTASGHDEAIGGQRMIDSLRWAIAPTPLSKGVLAICTDHRFLL